MEQEMVDAINKYGFPIIAAMGLGYFVYYIWRWVTTDIKPVISSASKTLIALVDRIRMLDNDMIRLNTKLSVLLEQKEKEGKITKEHYEKYISESETFDQNPDRHNKSK